MSFLKTITQRIRSCLVVEQTILNHAQRIANVLSERFASLADPAVAVPDFFGLQSFFLVVLQALRAALEEAEHRHVAKLAIRAGSRRRRDQAFGKLGSEMLGLRGFFDGVYRPADIRSMGFPAELGQTPLDLIRQGEHVVRQLAATSSQLVSPEFAAVTPDTAGMIESLDTSVGEMRTALSDVGRDSKRAELTRVDRERAQDAFDAGFLWIARTLESLFRLADEKELAERVRPSVRRRGRTAQIASEEGSPEGEAATSSEPESAVVS